MPLSQPSSGGGLPIASQVEAEAGIVNDKTMTPLRSAEAIAALGGAGGGGWITKTANYIAAPGDLIAADPNLGDFTITLPNNPPRGSAVQVAVASAGGTVTVHPDSASINGNVIDLTLTYQSGSVLLIFDGSGNWNAFYIFNGFRAPPLDTLNDPTDNTNLDSSAVRHGLLPKLSGSDADVLLGNGAFGELQVAKLKKAGVTVVEVDDTSGGRIRFFGATLTTRPGADVGANMQNQNGSGFADAGAVIAVDSGIVNKASTFTGGIGAVGYTIDDIVHALKILGLISDA